VGGRAFLLATSGVSEHPSTHLCYSEFGEVIGRSPTSTPDVTCIERARSHMEVLEDLNAVGFANSVGPGYTTSIAPRARTGEIVSPGTA